MVIKLTVLNRKNKHDRNTLYISVVNGKAGLPNSIRKMIATSIDVDLKKWDKTNQRVKSTDISHQILNHAILDVKIRCETARNKFESKQWNIEQVVKYLKGEASFDTIDEYLHTIMQPKLKPTTHQSYKATLNAVRKHLSIPKGKGVEWDRLLGYTNVETFKINAEKNGVSGVSLISYFKQIKVIYNDAFNNQYIYENFELHKNLRPKNTRPKSLQTNTVQNFLNAIDNSKTLYDTQTLGLYLLMFACRGMYQADIVQMSFENVVFDKKPTTKLGFKLNHFRHKTKDAGNDLMQIDVSAIMLALITMLKYGFIYTHSHLRPEILAKYDDALAIFDYDVNDTTLHIGLWDFYGKNCKRLLGMPFKTARKTFNTVALELAIPESIRRILLGHSDSSMLRHYDNVQADRIQKQVSEAHQKILANSSFETLFAKLALKVESLNPNYVVLTHTNFNKDGIISKDHQKVLETGLPKIKDGLKMPRHKKIN